MNYWKRNNVSHFKKNWQIPHPQAAVFWQIPTARADKMTNARQMQRLKLTEPLQAAQAHYWWVRASEVIWSEYTRIISVLSDAK